MIVARGGEEEVKAISMHTCEIEEKHEKEETKRELEKEICELKGKEIESNESTKTNEGKKDNKCLTLDANDPSILLPKKLNDLDSQFQTFLEMMRQLYVTIPYTEAIKDMPNYSHFLREATILREDETIETCSAIMKNKSPPKMSDLGSFSIPCAIKRLKFDNA